MREGKLNYGTKHSIYEQNPRGSEVNKLAERHGVSSSTIYRAKREGQYIDKLVSHERDDRNRLMQAGVSISPIIFYPNLIK